MSFMNLVNKLRKSDPRYIRHEINDGESLTAHFMTEAPKTMEQRINELLQHNLRLMREAQEAAMQDEEEFDDDWDDQGRPFTKYEEDAFEQAVHNEISRRRKVRAFEERLSPKPKSDSSATPAPKKASAPVDAKKSKGADASAAQADDDDA